MYSYFDLTKTKIYKSRVFYKFIQSKRNAGKTWGMHIYLINEFIKNKIPFVKFVRQVDMINPVAKGFFDGMGQMYFNAYDIKITTVGIYKFIFLYYKKDLELELKDKNFKAQPIHSIPMGAVVSLNCRDKMKSVSNSFCWLDDNKLLPIHFYMDEFQVEGKARYLEDEVEALQSILTSIIRDREGCDFYLTSNSISIMCPIFGAFGIDDILFNNNNLNYYEDVNNSWALQRLKSSQFGIQELKPYQKPFKNSLYLKSSIDNQYMDYNNFIDKLKGIYEQKVKFISSIGEFYIDYYKSQGLLYVNNDNKKNAYYICLSTKKDNHNVGLLFNTQTKVYLDQLRLYFDEGLVRFKNQGCKQAFYELIKY